jgi:hypothetical protein
VEVPLSREAILCCRRELRSLATSIATDENLPARGLANAFQLAFGGRGALYFQPESRDGVAHLANTVRATHAALGVSAEFDQSPLPLDHGC